MSEYLINKHDDFWCGIESGFPLCCIDFYINFWNPIRESKRMFSGRPECYDWIHGKGYVMCPECVIKNITTVATRCDP